jgi:hypothetical protein
MKLVTHSEKHGISLTMFSSNMVESTDLSSTVHSKLLVKA